MKNLSYSRQTIDSDDIDAVVDALGSDMLTQGPKVEEFEEALARYTGARYAVACSSGTSALQMAYQALDLKPGSSVITTPITFLSTINAALFTGALPAFADIDSNSFNIDVDAARERIADLKKSGNAPSVLVPVHYAGLPLDMKKLSEVARANDMYIIEDACHALGATDSAGKVGKCEYSDMTVFSFHPVKSITTGEGGAITTNDKKLYERLKLLRTHGVTKEASAFICEDIASSTPGAPWYYEMQSLSVNHRITDMQSALGLTQLAKLDGFIGRRKELATLYDGLFKDSPYVRRSPVSTDGSAHHLYVVRIPFSEIGVDKAKWFALMSEKGITLQVHYIPVHLQPYYREHFGFKPGDFPKAEEFYKEAVSLPLYPLLTEDEVRGVVATVEETLAAMAK